MTRTVVDVAKDHAGVCPKTRGDFRCWLDVGHVGDCEFNLILDDPKMPTRYVVNNDPYREPAKPAVSLCERMCCTDDGIWTKCARPAGHGLSGGHRGDAKEIARIRHQRMVRDKAWELVLAGRPMADAVAVAAEFWGASLDVFSPKEEK